MHACMHATACDLVTVACSRPEDIPNLAAAVAACMAIHVVHQGAYIAYLMLGMPRQLDFSLGWPPPSDNGKNASIRPLNQGSGSLY
jgi:hypothetical protein